MAEFGAGFHSEKLAKEYERQESSAMNQSVGEISLADKMIYQDLRMEFTSEQGGTATYPSQHTEVSVAGTGPRRHLLYHHF